MALPQEEGQVFEWHVHTEEGGRSYDWHADRAEDGRIHWSVSRDDMVDRGISASWLRALIAGWRARRRLRRQVTRETT